MDKESAHNRLLQAIDYLKDNGRARNHGEIAELTNTSRSNVTSAIGGNPRYITEPFLKRFASAYSNYINMDWLLTGEGEMAKTVNFEADAKMAAGYLKLVKKVYNSKLPFRPHIQAKASAGFMAGISEGEYGDNMRPMIPGILDYDFSITAYGKSMEPRIEDNDILACRIVTDNFNPPIGKICVIDSKDGAAVKVIKEVNDDCIVLHSLNPRYKDYSVNFTDLNQIALVVGSVRNY